MPTEDHSEIRKFMERAAQGQSNQGRELRFDTRTGKFVLTSPNEGNPDNIPQFTPEDLRSFGVRAGTAL